MGRPPDFDLSRAIAAAGFTPSQRDLPALLELVASPDEAVAAHAARALTRLPPAAVIAALARGDGDEAGAMRRVTALGQVARAHPAAGGDAALAAILADVTAPPRARRAAAVALGKVGGDVARDALARYWETDLPPDHRRSVAEALGKVGGDAVLAHLHALDPGDDKELARRRERALLMADRDARRAEISEIAVDVPPPAPLTVRLHCRGGLAVLLADELRALGFAPAVRGDGAVEIALAAPWQALFASRLWARAAIVAPLGSDLVASIVAQRPLLRAWTRGPIRWRLGFAHGHQRATVWRVAREVAAAAPELINDPTETTWDFLAGDDALELVPRRAPDPRFAYRVAEVPAASHPTVAAALAWLAGARAGERVWDPFCGSGLELVECARRTDAVVLLGSDVDDAALAAARQNLAAAGVAAELVLADARTHAPGKPVDAIVTNPPLGSRMQLDAPALLAAALPHLARQLAPGSGRLVWITPAPRRTGPVAQQAGLRLARSLRVDLGGVRGQLERWER